MYIRVMKNHCTLDIEAAAKWGVAAKCAVQCTEYIALQKHEEHIVQYTEYIAVKHNSMLENEGCNAMYIAAKWGLRVGGWGHNRKLHLVPSLFSCHTK